MLSHLKSLNFTQDVIRHTITTTVAAKLIVDVYGFILKLEYIPKFKNYN